MTAVKALYTDLEDQLDKENKEYAKTTLVYNADKGKLSAKISALETTITTTENTLQNTLYPQN